MRKREREMKMGICKTEGDGSAICYKLHSAQLQASMHTKRFFLAI